MTFFLLAAAAIAAYYYLRRPRTPRGGAGASATARARQLRTGAEAAQYKAGAEGERRTAALLSPLCLRLWWVLHDRALPRGLANVDHLVITLFGVIFVIDTKRWDYRFRVSSINGRLLHGTRDVTDRLDGLHHEARTVAAVLGRPVIPIVVMHGAPIDGGELTLDGIRIVSSDQLLPVLKSLSWRLSGFGPLIGWHAARLLPPYQEQAR